jgi:hypothetical protein
MDEPDSTDDPVSARDRIEAALFAANLAGPFTTQETDDQLIAELAQAESLKLTLADRLRASTGSEVAVSLATQDPTSQRIRGAIERVGVDHVVLRTERGLVVVRLSGVVSVVGLGVGARPATGLEATWTWRATLRRWIGDDIGVYLTTTGALRGPLERVAADHFDVLAPAGSFAVSWLGTAAVFNTNAHEIDVDDLLEA